jgi:hypothetical protein
MIVKLIDQNSNNTLTEFNPEFSAFRIPIAGTEFMFKGVYYVVVGASKEEDTQVWEIYLKKN